MIAELRMFERLLGVGIGGMSIYLGYRLFLALPNVRDASGEFRLPMDIRIILGRVGPGTFFALFGAAVVALSFHMPVRIDTAASPPTQSFSGLGSQPPSEGGAAQRADARALLRRDMAELNTLADKLRPDLAEPDRTEVVSLVRRVKLKLLHPVWESHWGDPAVFADWTASGSTETPGGLTEPAALFRYGSAP